MIIFKLLKIDNFYAKSENIEIAKGKYKLPETLKEGFKKIIREIKWQQKQAH
tara:strand:+ start:645 stop:800 length:156 start_codon:yes stop_codon:yes gene_type:complete